MQDIKENVKQQRLRQEGNATNWNRKEQLCGLKGKMSFVLDKMLSQMLVRYTSAVSQKKLTMTPKWAYLRLEHSN